MNLHKIRQLIFHICLESITNQILVNQGQNITSEIEKLKNQNKLLWKEIEDMKKSLLLSLK